MRPWLQFVPGMRCFDGGAQALGSDRRDMIWINCNPQAGREMKDIHPLLVLSPRHSMSGPALLLVCR